MRHGGFRAAGALALMGFCGMLTGCSSPAPAKKTDTAMANAAGTARLAFRQGDMKQAVRLYERALNRARAMDDSMEIANNAYNLALCKMTLKQYEVADALALEAIAETLRLKQDPGDLWLMQAQIARLTGRKDDANALAAKVLSDERNGNQRLQALMVKAQLALDEGKPAAARKEMGQARELESSVSDALLRADVDHLEGQLLMAEQEPLKAAPFFDRESDLRREGAQYRDMASALALAGQAYWAGGDAKAAWDRSYRAARSFFAQGDCPAALRAVKSAIEAAEKTGDEESQRRTVELFKQIEENVKQAEVK